MDPPRRKSKSSATTAPTEGAELALETYRPHRDIKVSRSLWAARVVFISILSAVAAVLGYLSFYYLSQAEKDLAEKQWDSITNRALEESNQIARGIKWSCSTLAEVVGQTLRDPEAWPFVSLKGYEEMASKMLNTINDRGEVLAFAPAVTTEQLPAWEDFAYDYFENVAGFPNDTGVSPFGKGTWGIGPEGRVRVTNGTEPGSPYEVVFPTFQSQIGPDPVLMFNLRSGELRKNAIDHMIECSLERMNATDPHPAHQCGSMTDMLEIVRFETRGPAIVLYDGVYPADGNGTELKGLIATLLLLDETLDKVFAANVRGVECVIEGRNDHTFTYSIVDGLAVPRGYGDLHDPAYSSLRRSTVLTDPDLYANTSQIYTLHIYPSDEFYAWYSTGNPKVATILTVCTIIFTTLFFFVFDCVVRREVKAKGALLDAKRQFMRFVSHEVRTPLNAVSMGLTVVTADLTSLLPCFSSSGDGRCHETTREDPKKGGISESECVKKYQDCIHLAQDIQAQVNSAVDILNDLLQYDKIESGELQLEYTFFPILDLVEGTSREFALPCMNKNLDLEMVFEVANDGNGTGRGNADVEKAMVVTPMSVPSVQDLPESVQALRVFGDSVRYVQVLRNLISNAIKFTAEGGTIRVRARRTEDAVMRSKASDFDAKHHDREVHAQSRGALVVDVEDSGVGMSADQLTKLFRPGVQFNKNEFQAGGGSGLGLYIAKGIIEQHGGSLSARSEGIDHGSTFTVTLPVWSIVDKGAGKGNPSNRSLVEMGVSDPTNDGSPNTNLKILCVDDALLNRKLLARLLRDEGHECDEAAHGEMAVEMVFDAIRGGRPYDAVLLDYEMPVMDGPSAAHEIRRNGCDVFIVGITGNMLPDDVSFFRSRGASAVLPKPVKLPDLKTLLMDYGVTR